MRSCARKGPHDGEGVAPIMSGTDITANDVDRFLRGGPRQLRLMWQFGGADWFQVARSIVDLVGLGLTLKEVRKLLMVGGVEAVHARMYREQRRAFEDWADGGELTTYLIREVKSDRDWTRARFRSRFGGESEDMRRLLDFLGYEPERNSDGVRV